MQIIKKKKNIWKELKINAYKYNRLFQVEIDVTYSCNASCFFCFQGNNHKDIKPILSFEKICCILDELKELGCFYVGFSGGEPFLRKDFLDILKYAKKLGFIVSFISNLQVPSLKVIQEITDIGINRITCSFHSIDKNRYCKIFNVDEKLYHNALNNIKFLKDNNNSVSIAATISTENFYDMNEIKKYFMNIGLAETDINFNLLIQGRNNIGSFRFNKLFSEYISEHLDLKHNIIEKSDCFLCSAGRISCSINPYGDVLPCTFFNSYAGNLYEQSLKEIWQKSHLLNIIRSIKENDFIKCSGCNVNKYCHVCMANNMNETKSYNIPSKEYCNFRQEVITKLLT